MKFDFKFEQFANSITGVSALTAATLLLSRKYDLAAFVFAALALGSVGVAWDRYSTKSGHSLDIRAFKKKRIPDESEMKFILTHAPYAALAVISFLADKKLKK